jgi:uncharacterized protein (DUF305 family)
MQINIDKKTGTLLGLVLILTLAVIFLLAGNSNSTMSHSDHGSMMTDKEASSSYTSSELMFAQMMIPHHQQALAMSELALKTSKNEEVLALAKQIRDAQTPEIEQMQNWLDVSDAPVAHDHSMEMGGMLTEKELTELASATGSNFDQLFLKGMIAHHEGAIHMAYMIKDTTNSEVKQLYTNIVTSQSAEIETMKELLK